MVKAQSSKTATGDGGRTADDLLEMLKWPGAALTTHERLWLRAMAAAHDGLVIVNIGVLWGASLACLRLGAPEARLIGVDIDLQPLKEPVEAELWEGDSTDLYKEMDVPIDFLFVDGDHHYDGVTGDIIGWVPLVRKGGLLAFHDYQPIPFDVKLTPYLADVARAVDTWFAESRDEWVRIPAPNSLAAFVRVH